MPVPVSVVSVEKVLFEGEADFILARTLEGEIGILPRHAPLLGALAPGELRIDAAGGRETMFVGGGFIEVLPDRVTVLADVAERADEINVDRAEKSRRDAEERLSGQVSVEERAVLEQALLRAEMRVRLARARRG